MVWKSLRTFRAYLVHHRCDIYSYMLKEQMRGLNRICLLDLLHWLKGLEPTPSGVQQKGRYTLTVKLLMVAEQ